MSAASPGDPAADVEHHDTLAELETGYITRVDPGVDAAEHLQGVAGREGKAGERPCRGERRVAPDQLVGRDGHIFGAYRRRTFYKDWGSGQPIVFSHGWPLSADDWDAQMMFIIGRGYRVITSRCIRRTYLGCSLPDWQRKKPAELRQPLSWHGRRRRPARRTARRSRRRPRAWPAPPRRLWWRLGRSGSARSPPGPRPG